MERNIPQANGNTERMSVTNSRNERNNQLNTTESIINKQNPTEEWTPWRKEKVGTTMHLDIDKEKE